MKRIAILLSLVALLTVSCQINDENEVNNNDGNEDNNNDENEVNKVLLLTVDYTTNTFIGGKEFEFSENSETFTITHEYVSPGDFGYIKLFYEEINELLFFGTIHWMGLGKMEYPQELLDATQFQTVPTNDLVYPKNGFEIIFGKTFDDETYQTVWLSVQNLTKARAYLKSNPEQIVRMFRYTPSVGEGDPKDWYWVIFLKQNGKNEF